MDEKLDPLQFAYQAGRDVEDAKLLILYILYKHLQNLQAAKLSHQLVLGILDILTDRVQRISVNGRSSDSNYVHRLAMGTSFRP